MPSIPIVMHDGSILESPSNRKEDLKSPKKSFLKQEARNRLMNLPSRSSSSSNISVFETKRRVLNERSSNKCFSNFKSDNDVTKELRIVPIMVVNSKKDMKNPGYVNKNDEKKTEELKTKKSDIYRAERVYIDNLDEDETDKTEVNKKLTNTVYLPSPVLGKVIHDNAQRNRFFQDRIPEKSSNIMVIL